MGKYTKKENEVDEKVLAADKGAQNLHRCSVPPGALMVGKFRGNIDSKWVK